MNDEGSTAAADTESALDNFDIDPVTLQVIGGELTTIAQEMGHKLIRSSYSSIIRESEDIGSGIFLPDGREIAESDFTPMHVGSLPGYLQGMFDTFEERGQTVEEVVNEGDVFIHNHPYYGASHSPDIGVMMPIFYEGEHIAWAGNTAHHLDIGSATPGLAIDLEDMYAEGTLFKATKVYEEGEPVEPIWDLIEDNVRTPKEVVGDLRAQIASCKVGKKRYLELIEEYGPDRVREAGEGLMAYAESLLRNEIRKIPDGTYEASGHLDDDGRNRDQRLDIHVEITIDGDDIIVDLSGSCDQVPTAYNVPFHGSTDVCVYFVVRSMLLDTYTFEGYLPQNSGTFEPVDVRARKGCIFNPESPTSAMTRINQVDKMADLMLKALSDVIPEKVCAGTCGQATVISYSGTDEQDDYWVYIEVNEGSYGGRPDKDGLDAVDALVHNSKNRPVEDIELSHPLRVDRYELREEEHGAGKYRGGHGIVRESHFLTDGTITVEGDGSTFGSWGMLGGSGAGSAKLEHVTADGETTELHSKVTGYKLQEGDTLRISSISGGGYGDPMDRPVEKVFKDYQNEMITAEIAREEYGVVIEDGEVDEAATADLRGN